MKIRTDFVTNSSSSSFIGVFGEVKDNVELMECIKQFNLSEGDYKIFTGEQLLEDMEDKWYDGYGADWAGVYISPSKDKINPNSLYFIFESYGGAGDSDGEFWEDGYDDYDYNVSYEDFGESKFIDSIRKCVDIKEEGYGAGRNG